MKFQDDISNMNTHIHTDIHADKPKPICPPLLQSWGHNENIKNSHLYPRPPRGRGLAGLLTFQFSKPH